MIAATIKVHGSSLKGNIDAFGRNLKAYWGETQVELTLFTYFYIGFDNKNTSVKKKIRFFDVSENSCEHKSSKPMGL